MRSDYAALELYKKRSRRKFRMNFFTGMFMCAVVILVNLLLFDNPPNSRTTLLVVFLVLVLSSTLVVPVIFKYSTRLRRLLFDDPHVNESAFSVSWSYGSLHEHESSTASARKYHLLQLAVAVVLGYFFMALLVLVSHYLLR